MTSVREKIEILREVAVPRGETRTPIGGGGGEEGFVYSYIQLK